MRAKNAITADQIEADRLIPAPNGHTAMVRIIPDETMGAPWDENDGHGIVSEWTSRPKAPGELVLARDRDSFRYYDFASTVRIARKDGWGAPDSGRTVGERAALAAMQDFRRLRDWCNDEWCWIGVHVKVLSPDGTEQEDSLWGIESDGDYWKDVAAELINGLAQ